MQLEITIQSIGRIATKETIWTTFLACFSHPKKKKPRYKIFQPPAKHLGAFHHTQWILSMIPRDNGKDFIIATKCVNCELIRQSSEKEVKLIIASSYSFSLPYIHKMFIKVVSLDDMIENCVAAFSKIT